MPWWHNRAHSHYILLIVFDSTISHLTVIPTVIFSSHYSPSNCSPASKALIILFHKQTGCSEMCLFQKSKKDTDKSRQNPPICSKHTLCVAFKRSLKYFGHFPEYLIGFRKKENRSWEKNNFFQRATHFEIVHSWRYKAKWVVFDYYMIN